MMSPSRQQKLEESLLFSGKFTDALQALMDWLYRAEPQLSEEMPLAGDRDLVADLLEKHKAQEFHTLVTSFLEGLHVSERTLKCGVIPEEEQALQECQTQQQELMNTLQCQQMALECIVSLGQEILSACHPDSIITIKSWLNISKTRYQEVTSWARQQGERIEAQIQSLATEREEVTRLMDWITAAEEALGLRDQEPLTEEMSAVQDLIAQHSVFMEELNRKEPEVEKVTKSCKRKIVDLRATTSRKTSAKRQNLEKSTQSGPCIPLQDLAPRTPHMTQLLNRWQQLWFLALDRQCRLQGALQRLHELQEFAHFDFAVWRKRYMQWIGQMKSRILDVFRGIDRDQDGRISQQEFMESVLSSILLRYRHTKRRCSDTDNDPDRCSVAVWSLESCHTDRSPATNYAGFPTNSLEMTAVANIFDINRDGFIDYYEFVSALHPSRDPLRRIADADQIQDEVNRQVAQCNCAKRFQVEQISANRYRFGESQQLRMVRILRSTLMVRVGGGWIALDEFLVKNDPCRAIIIHGGDITMYDPVTGQYVYMYMYDPVTGQYLYMYMYDPVTGQYVYMYRYDPVTGQYVYMYMYDPVTGQYVYMYMYDPVTGQYVYMYKYDPVTGQYLYMYMYDPGTGHQYVSMYKYDPVTGQYVYMYMYDPVTGQYVYMYMYDPVTGQYVYMYMYDPVTGQYVSMYKYDPVTA
ncbi:unnamed protein product, partial [Ranitomeya imitator]